MFSIKNNLINFIKKITFKHSNLGKPNFQYNLEPEQLSEIIISLKKVKNIKGCICEIGVARGMTTRFICEHLVKSSEETSFYCIDTFSSFESEDVDYEIKNRNKNKSDIEGFKYNDFKKWKENFKNFKFVKPIKTDAKKFNFNEIMPIKLAIVDVDLYLPTIAVLNKIKDCMSKGGIIIVDDVKENEKWDGAHQAFHEFVKKHSLNYRLVGQKCGVIEF